MKKRLLAAMLALTMIVDLTPSGTMEAFAAETDTMEASDDAAEVSVDAAEASVTEAAETTAAEENDADLSVDLLTDEEDTGAVEETDWRDTAIDISEDEASDAFDLAQSEIQYYKFVPETDGTYVFGSTGNYDTYGYLYDADKTQLTDDDDSGTNNNCQITYTLTAGTTYYFAVCGYSKRAVTGISVYLYRSTLVIANTSQSVTASYTDALTLTASATAEKEMTYAWYKESVSDSNLLDCTESTYTIAAEKYPDETCTFYCVVTAGQESKTITYSVTVEGYPDFREEAIEIALGTTTDSFAIAADQKVYYKFTTGAAGYYTMGTLGDASTSGYLYDAEKNCKTNDTWGNGDGDNFRINGYYLAADTTYYVAVCGRDFSAVDSTQLYVYRRSLTIEDHDDVTAEYAKDTVITVNATADTDITYQWYKNYVTESNLIAGAADASYTIPAESYTSSYQTYVCLVTAGYETQNVYFYVEVSGMLEASAKDNENYLTPSYTEDCTMEVTATASGSISYQWVKYNRETYEYEDISGATEASYTIPAGSYEYYYLNYRCKVTCGSQAETVYFTVEPQSITVTADEDITAKEGDEVTLHVTASSCFDNSNLTYDWGMMGGSSAYMSADRSSSSYTYTVNEYTAHSYYVNISDGFSSIQKTITVTYSDYSPASFTAWVNSRSGSKGTAVTLTPYINRQDDNSDLSVVYSYTWYKGIYNQETMENDWEEIEGETSSSLQVTIGNSSDQAYALRIGGTDSNGVKCASFWTETYIYNNDYDDSFRIWNSSANNASLWGETATYKILELNGCELEDASYQWYEAASYDSDGEPASWKKIDGANGTFYSFVADENSAQYYKVAVYYDDAYDTETFHNTASSIKLVNKKTSLNLRYGKTGSFSVSASSIKEGAAITYQWQKLNTSTYNYEDISGAVSSSYQVPLADQTKKNLAYQCIISDGYSTKTVECDAYIYRIELSFDFNGNAVYGQDKTVTANVTGETSDLSYKWSWNWDVLEGQTGSTCTIPADQLAAPGSSRYLQCTVTTADGFTTSYGCYIATARTVTLAETRADLVVDYASAAELTVNASTATENALTYQWYRYDSTSGTYTACEETSAVYTLSAEDTVVPSLTYRCTVSDQITTVTEYFYVTVDKLKVSGQGCNTLSLDGKDVTLKVNPAAADAVCQWKVYDEETSSYIDIEDAVSTEYTVSVPAGGNERLRYSCTIASGEFSDTEYFDVYTDSTLAVMRDYRLYEGEKSFTLSVAAVTSTGNAITYQWQKANGSTYEDLEGETSHALTIDAASLSGCELDYRCIVSDGTSEAEEVFDDYYSPFVVSYDSYTSTSTNENMVLQMNASSVMGDVAYQWKTYDDETNEYTDIDGAVTDSLTLTPDMFTEGCGRYYYFYCVLTSGQFTMRYEFSVYVSDLTLTYTQYVYASAGSKQEVTVNAVSADNSELFYTWITYDDEFNCWMTEEADGNTLTVDMTGMYAGETKQICCTVSDGTESRSGYIYLIAENPFTFASNLTTIPAAAGESVTMNSAASAPSDEGTLSYQWYTWDGTDRKAITGATSSSYAVTGSDSTTSYQCKVQGAKTYTYRTFTVVCTTKLELDQTCDASVSRNNKAWYKFTAPEAGNYTIESQGSGDSTVYAYTIADGCLKQCGYNDDSGTGNNFRLTLSLTKNQTVYYAVGAYNSNAIELTVTLTKSGTGAYFGPYYKWVLLGEDTVLTVDEEAQAEGCSYQWYFRHTYYDYEGSDSVYYMIDGATSAEYTAKSQTYENEGKEYAVYECIVTYADGSTKNLFWYLLYNTITVKDNGSDTRLKQGEPLVLHITAESNMSSDLKYQWYYNEPSKSTEIAGADSPDLIYQAAAEWKVDSVHEVTCIVDDGYTTEEFMYQIGVIANSQEDISDASVTLPASTYTWTGSAITPDPVVALDGEVLTKGTDYTVSYSANINPGKATVTVTGIGTYEGSVSATFTINAATPVLSKIENTTTGVKLTWTGTLPTGCSYLIYRKSGTSGYARLTTTTAATYTDTSAASGTSYTYTVRVVTAAMISASGFNAAGLTITYIAAPSNIKAVNAATGVKVTWTASTGAAKYRIFRKTGTGSYARLADTTAASYTDTTAVSGTTYTYIVRCLSSDAKSYTSALAAAGAKILYLKQPAPTLANAATGVTIKWAKVTGASGYYVYRKTGTGSWSRIATVAATTAATLSYTDTKATGGVTYYYTVRAYSGTTTSTFVTNKTILYLKMPSPAVAKVSTGIKVSWAKTTGAKGYYVYRKVSGGSWTRIKTITSGSTVSYIDTTAKTGTTYYYTVKAYNGTTVSAIKTSAAIKR